ncbi:MAG: hypothetical protein RSB29_03360 [Alistipes sp.]
MKKSVFMLVVATSLLIGIGAFAQNSNRPIAVPPEGQRPTMEQRVKNQTDHLRTTLALTDEQTQKVYDLKLKNAKQRQALRAECAAQMKQILTTEQFATWEKSRQSRGCVYGEQPSPRHRVKPGAGCCDSGRRAQAKGCCRR